MLGAPMNGGGLVELYPREISSEVAGKIYAHVICSDYTRWPLVQRMVVVPVAGGGGRLKRVVHRWLWIWAVVGGLVKTSDGS